jgi:choloylglycine hydrolase
MTIVLRNILNKVAIISMLFSSSAWACTEVRVTADNGAIVIGRSMEFGVDVDSNLVVQPRGQKRISSSSDGSKGLSWVSKYGILYMDGFQQDIAADGMNEKGLSFGALYLPGFAEYQTVPKGSEAQALGHLDIGLWILGNFATVDEVRDALPTVHVWAQPVKDLNNVVLPLHYSVYDKSGKGMVFEYTNAGLKMHENTLGIMTNSPPYDWHMTNVRNYISLTAFDPSPKNINGVSFSVNGIGTGMVGLPGDFSPPSRLVRTSTIAHHALPVKDNEGAVNLCEHLMNSVDIPLGAIRDKEEDGSVEYDRTLWVVMKDLQAKMLYFRSYGDLAMKLVDMNKLDFSKKGKRGAIRVEHGEPTYIDITDKLQ